MTTTCAYCRDSASWAQGRSTKIHDSTTTPRKREPGLTWLFRPCRWRGSSSAQVALPTNLEMFFASGKRVEPLADWCQHSDHYPCCGLTTFDSITSMAKKAGGLSLFVRNTPPYQLTVCLSSSRESVHCLIVSCYQSVYLHRNGMFAREGWSGCSLAQSRRHWLT